MPEAKLDAETIALLRQMLGADEPDEADAKEESGESQTSEEQGTNSQRQGEAPVFDFNSVPVQANTGASQSEQVEDSESVSSDSDDLDEASQETHREVPDDWYKEANGELEGTSSSQDDYSDDEDYDDDYNLSYDDEDGYGSSAEDVYAASPDEGVVEPVEPAQLEQSFVPDPIQPASPFSQTYAENTETSYEQSSPVGDSEPVSPFSNSYSNTTPEPVPVQTNTSEQEYQRQSIEEMRQLNAALMAQIAKMQGQLVTMQEFINSNEQKKYNDNARQRVFSREQPFEKITFTPCTSTYNGQPFSYQRYEEPVRFSRRFEICTTDEDTAKSYVAFVEEVTRDVEKKFGGFKHITSMAVIDSIIIFNGISYEPLLPEEYTANLPFDIRNAVLDGKFAWLFDFGSLKKMTALTDLKFDSADFVFSKVRKDMHLFGEFNVSKFFKTCPSLQRIEIGGDCVTVQDTRAVDEKFHKSSRVEEIYNKCYGFGFGRMKAGWGSIKDVYHDPDRGKLSKAWGITWRGVGTAAATAGTGVVKGGGLLAKLGKNVVNFTSSLKDNLK